MSLALSRGFHFRRGLYWRAMRPVTLGRMPRRQVVMKVVLWVVAAVAFAGGLLQTSLFTVNRIDVAGSTHLSRDDVLSVAKLKTGGSIAAIDTNEAEERLEKHPWVLHARVDAKWPHVVAVTIVEQRAVAIAQTGDKKWAQLGPDGTVLSIDEKPAARLPAVLGLQAPTEVGAVVDRSSERLISVATLMPESLQPRVLQMQDQNEVLRLGLDAGTVVVLGNADQLNDKLLSAASVLSQTDPKTLAELDVTSPRFPVARPLAQTTISKPTQLTTGTTGASSTKSTKTTSTTTKKQSSTTVTTGSH